MMRRLMVMGLVAALAVAQINDTTTTGQGWREWPPLMRSTYAAGFVGGYLVGVTNTGRYPISKSTKAGQLCSCMTDMTYGQLTAVMDKYVADHPEKWNKPIFELFDAALTKACADRDAR